MTIPSERDLNRPRPAQPRDVLDPDQAARSAMPGAVRSGSEVVRGTAPRIAVFRALALGDLLCAVPALRSLRAANPNARITLIGLPWARSFVERFPMYLDDFVEFPGYPGIPEMPFDPARLTRFLAGAQKEPFDLAIQLQGNGLVSNGFVQLLGARRTAGYYLPAVGCPDDETFAPYPGHGPEIRRHLSLMEFLGFPARGEDLEFPLGEADEAAARRLMRRHGLRDGGYAIVHAGASIVSRRWPPERFAEVADALAQNGLTVVLTGTRPERGIAEAVAGAMHCPAIDLAGSTDLGAMAALLRRARILLSNDTGIAHLAAALRVPSVVVFLGSERDRWAALDGRLHVAVGRGSVVGCRDHGDAEHACLRDACAFPRPDDVPHDVSIDEVREAVLGHLEATADPGATNVA